MATEYLMTDKKEEEPRSKLKDLGESERAEGRGESRCQNTAPLPRPTEEKAYLAILHMGQALLPSFLIQEAYQRHAVHVVGVSRGRKQNGSNEPGTLPGGREKSEGEVFLLQRESALPPEQRASTERVVWLRLLRALYSGQGL